MAFETIHVRLKLTNDLMHHTDLMHYTDLMHHTDQIFACIHNIGLHVNARINLYSFNSDE